MTPNDIRRIAQQMAKVDPEKAAAIEKALAEVGAGKRDLATINVGINYRLEKFNGDFRPGLAPVEVIEGKG